MMASRMELLSRETDVLSAMGRAFAQPGPRIPEVLSSKELAEILKLPKREVENTCRRLKRKGFIEESWERQNPDQPSGEYNEVWSSDPYIPKHGYVPTRAGMEHPAYTLEAERTIREWDEYWEKALKGGSSG